MGFSDGLTNGTFKKDRRGNIVFFPWGVLGRGRVLPDAATEARVRRFVRLHYLVMLPMVIGVGMIFGWAWSFLLVPVFGFWFYLGTKALVSRFPYSEETLTLKDSLRNSAAGYNRVVLWFLLLLFVLVMPVSIFMVINADSAGLKLLGWVSLLFFGAFCLAIGYMLKEKA